jgi:hypothetical protein
MSPAVKVCSRIQQSKFRVSFTCYLLSGHLEFSCSRKARSEIEPGRRTLEQPGDTTYKDKAGIGRRAAP